VCAVYAERAKLLDTDGWKQFRWLVKRPKVLDRQFNQAKLSSYQSTPLFKFGYQVPRNHKEGLTLDEKNGNTKYRDAEKLEMSQHAEYLSKALERGALVQMDTRRYVCTSLTTSSTAVVTRQDLWLEDPSKMFLCVFLAVLNDLQVHAADVGNAYLEAEKKEKVYIIGGPGFGELEGHTLIIHKALYGLRSSGLRWHDRFANTLRDMGFVPSKADTDIWMRRNGDIWEYIATYVDDLAIIMKDPKSFTF